MYLPPTSQLPAIKKILFQDLDSLNASISYLRTIYNPEVRGSRRRKIAHSIDFSQPTSTYGNAELDVLRLDSFERAYAIRWLTSLISQLGSESDHEYDAEVKCIEKTIQNAAGLLAVCAGTSAAGTIVRKFTFPYYEGKTNTPIPITVQLTDTSLDNDDYGSVGAQTWGGACVLSELIVDKPSNFGLCPHQIKSAMNIDGSRGSLRILELGAGTGLVSLTTSKFLQCIPLPIPLVEIVATDYYPSVLQNLHTNIQNNSLSLPEILSPSKSHYFSETQTQIKLTAQFLDWSTFNQDHTQISPFDKPFDLILGADIVYETEHALWIHYCLQYLLPKPTKTIPASIMATPQPQPLFHLVIPLRSTHSSETSTIEEVFKPKLESNSSLNDIGMEELAPSPSLEVIDKDILTCDTETGEEVEYAYYRIGWVY